MALHELWATSRLFSDGWGVSVSGNGTIGAVLHKSNVGTVNIFAGDGKVVSDGQWHHVAVVFSRAANMVRYVDGAPSGAQNSLAFLAGQSVDNTNQLRMGARDQSGDELFFKGLIDDVRSLSRLKYTCGIGAILLALRALKAFPGFAYMSLPQVFPSEQDAVDYVKRNVESILAGGCQGPLGRCPLGRRPAT